MPDVSLCDYLTQILVPVQMQFVGSMNFVTILTGGMSVFAILPGQDLTVLIMVRFNNAILNIGRLYKFDCQFIQQFEFTVNN